MYSFVLSIIYVYDKIPQRRRLCFICKLFICLKLYSAYSMNMSRMTIITRNLPLHWTYLNTIKSWYFPSTFVEKTNFLLQTLKAVNFLEKQLLCCVDNTVRFSYIPMVEKRFQDFGEYKMPSILGKVLVWFFYNYDNLGKY